MPEQPVTAASLSQYRMQRAVESLEEANILLSAEQWKGAANRSYYAIFHAIRAVLALEGVDYKKHSAVISHFRQYYIKPGKFPIEFSSAINDLFRIRLKSDYDDFFVVSKTDVIDQIAQAEQFLSSVKQYLSEQ